MIIVLNFHHKFKEHLATILLFVFVVKAFVLIATYLAKALLPSTL